jgi:hypothetical protein
MMRIAAFSSARIFGGLRRLRFGAVLFGIWAIWEKAQRRLMHPRRDAISCRPDLPITNDGAVEGRLLGSAAEVDPGSDATCRRLVFYAATNLGFVQSLQDYSRAGGVSKVGMG